MAEVYTVAGADRRFATKEEIKRGVPAPDLSDYLTITAADAKYALKGEAGGAGGVSREEFERELALKVSVTDQTAVNEQNAKIIASIQAKLVTREEVERMIATAVKAAGGAVSPSPAEPEAAGLVEWPAAWTLGNDLVKDQDTGTVSLSALSDEEWKKDLFAFVPMPGSKKFKVDVEVSNPGGTPVGFVSAAALSKDGKAADRSVWVPEGRFDVPNEAVKHKASFVVDLSGTAQEDDTHARILIRAKTGLTLEHPFVINSIKVTAA